MTQHIKFENIRGFLGTIFESLFGDYFREVFLRTIFENIRGFWRTRTFAFGGF